MHNVMELIATMEMGGAQALVKDYSMLAKSNIQIVALYPTNSSYENQLLESGKNVDFLDTKRRSWLFRHTIGPFYYGNKIKSYIKSRGITCIHMHLGINKHLCCVGKALKSATLFHTVHNEPQRNFGSRQGAATEKFCTQHLINKFGMRLIALHDDMRKELNEMFNVDNTVVINNGIDMERFNPTQYQDSKLPRKTDLGFAENDFVVGHIGRFTNQKNHKFLIDIFSKLCERKSNAKLLLIGSGELKTDAVAQIKSYGLTDRVVWLENRKDIPELLSVMDIFLFPSLFEGLGIVLIEAQAMGVKCVVSDPVPKAAHVTSNYISLSLDAPIDEWCSAILDDEIETMPHMSLKDYDMREIVKKLERLYVE